MTESDQMETKEQEELDERFQRRLAELPAPVQKAINSADVGKKLRSLAERHKLHLDKWELLETEVNLALYGFQPAEDLEKNIRNEVGVSGETAAELTSDISREIFEPIRQELERELEHPEAKAKEASDVEATRTQVLRDTAPTDADNVPPPPPAPPPVQPATPPPPPPSDKAVRGPASGAYRAGGPSSARKDIHDDPYREPPA